MRAVVKKWGNSASVRIPAGVFAAANLHLDQAVDVREEHGTIIEPIVDRSYDLATLVTGITDENRHNPVETAGPAGQEAW